MTAGGVAAPGGVPAAVESPLLPIGAVAQRLGVSTRTLRYYEELGLVAPSGRTKGGSRRYAEADVERVQHIRELQQVLGFNLDEIAEILGAEARLAELRTEYKAGVSPKRQTTIIYEAMELNARLQQQVDDKIGVLEGFRAELRATARRYRDVATERGIPLPDSVPHP
ncbi:MAG: MerR family transcriptional regulator [Actinobacteria bacterium]|nr:MerR family transcriptional regulator [Actinomycetota bacterium]